MNYQELKLKVKQIIASQFGTSPENIRDDESLLASVDGDSLDVVELLLAVEDEFSLEIPEEIVEDLNTVEKIARHLLSVGATDKNPRSSSKDDVLW